MTINEVLRLLWAGTAFVVSVLALWLAYRAVSHAVNTQFSLKDWLDDLASVNFRMVVALGLFALTIIVLLAGVVVDAGGVFRADIDEDIIRLILLAEFGAMGWDVFAYIGKRATFKPDAPDNRRDENATVATTTTTVVVPEAKPAEPPQSRNLTDFRPRPAADA